MAYFDPPYATEFSQTNYERAYHFIEGLMTWWEGKEIQAGSKTRQYEIPTEVTRANAGQFFTEFLGAAKHIPHWIISYRDHAFPTEPEIKKIIAAAGKSSRMQSKEHKYSISAKHGENSVAKEHLFVCSPAEGKTAGEVEQDGLHVVADPEGSGGPGVPLLHDPGGRAPGRPDLRRSPGHRRSSWLRLQRRPGLHHEDEDVHQRD